MPRIEALTTDAMTTAQRRVYDAIMNGPRGGMGGPFHAWLHSPELADRAQHLGAYCRFDSALERVCLSLKRILHFGSSWRIRAA